jgi:hypothetical protein
MKKLLGGCLVVLVIALIGFGAAGFYAYRLAKPMLESTASYLDRAREMIRLSDRINNQSPFVPAAGGELAAAQVDRFLAVQARVRDELGDRWSEIEARSADIRKKTQDNHRDLTFAEFTGVFSDLANIYLEARRAQVNALNIHKFSDAEYSWVRLRIYQAAGMELVGGINLSAVEELARDGSDKTNVTLPEVPRPDVPAANTRLVKPHLATIKALLPLALLGL